MKILITGVAGLIGSNLLKELLDREDEVIGIDNLSQGSLENIQPFLEYSNFHFIQDDILSLDHLVKLSKDVDVIVHLASYKIPRYSNSLKTLEINSRGTENVLEAARLNDCKVVFASTDDVYGKNEDLPLVEEGALVIGESKSNRWSDAVSKIYAEHLCFAYQEKYQLPIAIIRYFGVYGPNQRRDWWGGPIPVFVESSLQNKAMPIHGDGAQTRSYVFVSDAVTGTMQILESPYAHGEVVNIGSDTEISIINLAYLIWRLSKNKEKPKLDFIPYSDFSRQYEDVRHRRPDISKVKYLLAYQPKVNLEEGLERTIRWQRNQLFRKRK
ncbi:MAG: NAD-dependent epimerase/dehydratase family protein [bacterium]